MSTSINLNADLGESFGAWTMGDDEALLALVGSANIACGFHAGDPLVMRRTVRRARELGVSIGAHPSYPDLQGFGRRRMQLSGDELEAAVIYQVGALAAMAAAEGARLTHVKPHGALNNVACAELEVARTIARAVAAVDRSLIFLAPSASQLAFAGREAGLPVVEEIFADRAYLDDGQLVPRNRPGAVLHDPDACLAHVRRMLDEQALVSVTGTRVAARPQSICVHGDGPEAVTTARRLREGLLAAGYSLVSLPELARG